MSNYADMINGLYLSIGLGVGGGAMVTVDCETEFTDTLTTQMNESTCKENKDTEQRPFKTFIPGKHTGEVSISGRTGQGGAGKDVFDMIKHLKGGDVIDYAIRNTTTGTAVDLYTTKALVQSVETQNPDNDTATFSLTLGQIETPTIV